MYPSNREKLDYAEKVMTWAERFQPVKDFDPGNVPPMTDAELKLLDAMVQVDSVEDTDAHRAAVEYAYTLEHPISTFIGDQAKDKATEDMIEFLFGKTAEKLFSRIGTFRFAFGSAVTGDDDACGPDPLPGRKSCMEYTDDLKIRLRDEFAKYLDKRLLQHAAQTKSTKPATVYQQ